jgi:hypothetical protein
MGRRLRLGGLGPGELSMLVASFALVIVLTIGIFF